MVLVSALLNAAGNDNSILDATKAAVLNCEGMPPWHGTRKWLVTPLAALVLGSSGVAQAAPVLIIDAAPARSEWGQDALIQKLRKSLQASGVAIIAERASKKTRQKKGDGRISLARAQQLGADCILRIATTKKGWMYSANATLIAVATGETKMDFTSSYYKPKSEASDRGDRIARVTRDKLDVLFADEEVAPKSTAIEIVEEPTPAPPPRDSPLASPPPSVAPPRVAEPPPPQIAPRADEPPIARADPVNEPAASSPPPVQSTRSPPQSPLVRVSASGGSGLIHKHVISSAASGRSSLSYSLPVLMLMRAEADVRIASTGLSVFARGLISPFRIQVDLGAPQQASGWLVDAAIFGRLPLVLATLASGDFVLSPAAGIRFISLQVGTHRGNIVHARQTFAPALGVDAVMPLSRTMELGLGLEAGWVLGYTESPSSDGTLGLGILLGGDLALRWWAWNAWGFVLNVRGDWSSIGLRGQSNRQPKPADETLRDVTLSGVDLRASLGVMVRYAP